MSRHQWRKIARRAGRILGFAAVSVLALALAAGALFVLEVLSREPLRAIPSTVHPSIARGECLDCHAPIAEEWRQSYHYLSLTGPYWKDVRELGYLEVFDRTRKACVNCHAPAAVLDLVAAGKGPSAGEASSTASEGPAASSGSLGVECTPNLLREPRGVVPPARSDQPELGVDCTSCHVSRRGIAGPGRHATAAHEVLADSRFQDPRRTSETLCRTCHGATVRTWQQSPFASAGVTCLDCHMPWVTAASTTGGPPRTRRSHRFLGDKDPSRLESAVDASLVVTGASEARFRITNSQVGHHLPSGGNWLSVRLKAYDSAGEALREQLEVYGKDEPLLLDFWPFNRDRRIPAGETREIVFPLPEGPGTVEAVVRYHDWIRTGTTIARLTEDY